MSKILGQRLVFHYLYAVINNINMLKIQNTLLIAVIAIVAVACASAKKEHKKEVAQPKLSEQIIGSWTTEGSAEQIDEYLMAGYGQQIVLNADSTFEMSVVMSISGVMPYDAVAVPVTATFGAEMKGKYSVADKSLTLVYDGNSIVAHMSPDDVSVDITEYADQLNSNVVKAALLERLSSTGLTQEMLEQSLKETVKGHSRDTFTNVTVKDDRLQMTLDGSTTVYIRD